MVGLVGITYFVMAACVAICLGSVWFSWQTRRELRRVQLSLRELQTQYDELRVKYDELRAWVIAKGLKPPELST